MTGTTGATLCARMSAEGETLIIGAGGRMGAALARRLTHNRKVIAFRREQLIVLAKTLLEYRHAESIPQTIAFGLGKSRIWPSR